MTEALRPTSSLIPEFREATFVSKVNKRKAPRATSAPEKPPKENVPQEDVSRKKISEEITSQKEVPTETPQRKQEAKAPLRENGDLFREYPPKPKSISFCFDFEVMPAPALAFINLLRQVNAADPKMEVKLVINSDGGSIESMMDMIKQMGHYENPISTLTETRAMSAGTLLLAAGDKGYRYAYEDAVIMVHHLSSEERAGMKSTGDYYADARRMGKLDREYFKNLEKFTGRRIDQWYKEIDAAPDKILYLTPEKAKKYGIIDHIIPKPKKNPHPEPQEIFPK